MLVYLASSLDPNWVIWLFDLGEKRETISDHSNTETWILLSVIFAIVIGIMLQLHLLARNRESNSNGSVVDDQSLKAGEKEHPSDGELDQYLFGGHDIHCRWTTPAYVDCSLCGNPSTTRCSRCKAARYCSVECQIRHWRSGHKHECSETDTSSADKERGVHVREASLFVNKSGKNGSHGEGVKQSSIVKVGSSCGSDASNYHACQVCGRPSTTRCSRCKVIKYCSAQCLILDWKWHKLHCVARDVNSFPPKRPLRDVTVINNSCEDEQNAHSFSSLYLEPYAERTTSFKSPIKRSQDLMKETNENRTKCIRYFEDEVTESRNEIRLLELERDKWMMRANLAKERFRSLRKESENQLFVLKNEKESISNAERQAQNVIHNLNERLYHVQIAFQESITEKKKLREHIQMVECELDEIRKDLQKEQKQYRCLKIEYDKSQETSEDAIRDVQRVKQELQVQQEQIHLLKEEFLREVTSAKSRASFAETKFNDLHKKIKSADNKICAICLTNEKDLAFGCGHMTCVDCGSKLSRCPICREHITSHIKLFPG